MPNLPLDILELYCDRYCQIPLVMLDQEGCIIYANRAFTKRLSLPGVPTGEKICGFLELDLSMNDPIHYDPKTNITADLVTASYTRNGERNSLRGHVFFDGSRYVAIFDIFKEHDVEILEQVTRMNLEMSSLTRDYSKQYRVMDKQAKENKKLAHIDQLTQLANRRHFDQAAQEALQRSDPFGIILLDIDNFKEVNDTFGHDKGDEVLIAIAQAMQKNIRQQDIPARYGGEEFILLVYCSSYQRLYSTAEKVRMAIAAQHIESIGRTVTASFGITLRSRGDTLAAMIKRADTALYRAKNAGKNCTEHEAPPSPAE